MRYEKGAERVEGSVAFVQGLEMAAFFSQGPVPGVYPNRLSKSGLYFSTIELILGLISSF
jgi:hypothetical protein